MALTNRQIERYSRQLIVPDFGGVAQERLLAARLLLIANHADADSVLAYLVGAGVGQIDLRTDLDAPASAALIARMRDLNSDPSVRIGPRISSEFGELGESGQFDELDLALVLASDAASLGQIRVLCERLDNVADKFRPNLAIILARLDHPARIAVIPRRPPCPQCARVGELLAPIGARAGNAGLIAMLAALEAIKLLAQLGSTAQPRLIEFRGYESSAQIIDSVSAAACGCAASSAAKNAQMNQLT